MYQSRQENAAATYPHVAHKHAATIRCGSRKQDYCHTSSMWVKSRVWHLLGKRRNRTELLLLLLLAPLPRLRLRARGRLMGKHICRSAMLHWHDGDIHSVPLAPYRVVHLPATRITERLCARGRPKRQAGGNRTEGEPVVAERHRQHSAKG